MKRLLLIAMILSLLIISGFASPSDTLFQVYDANEGNALGELQCIEFDISDHVYIIGGDGNRIIQRIGNDEYKIIYQIEDQDREADLVDFIVDDSGKFYAIESTGHVLILGADGKLNHEWYVDAEEVKLNSIDIDSKYNLYITDSINNRILKYSPDGEFMKEYKNRYICYPLGVYIDKDDNIYYGYYWESNGLYQMDQNGELIRIESMPTPDAIYIDKENNIFVSEYFSMQIFIKDFSQRIEYWPIDDDDIYPEAENPKIVDFAVNSRGRIFVIRDNKILVCDKYYKGTDAAWIIWAGVATALLAGGVAAVLVRRRRKAGAE